MLIDVVMPQLGESVVEGVVVKWLVEVGELVAKDQPLLEISTDKVDAEIPSPSAGRVAQILVKPGETVPIQAVLAKLETDPAASQPAPEAAPKWDEETEGFPGHMARKTEPPIPAPPRVEPSAPPPPPPPATGRIRITPVVGRMAAEHGLDLSKIPGTGIDGRVTRKDVEGYLASSAPGSEAPAKKPKAAGAKAAPSRAPIVSPPPGRRGPGRPVDADPEEDRGAHGPEQAHLAPRPHLRRGGHAQGGGGSGQGEEGGREPHLSSLRDPRRGEGAARDPDHERDRVRREHGDEKGYPHRRRGRHGERACSSRCCATRTGCP